LKTKVDEINAQLRTEENPLLLTDLSTRRKEAAQTLAKWAKLDLAGISLSIYSEGENLAVLPIVYGGDSAGEYVVKPDLTSTYRQ
jgi:hypothetical protein